MKFSEAVEIGDSLEVWCNAPREFDLIPADMKFLRFHSHATSDGLYAKAYIEYRGRFHEIVITEGDRRMNWGRSFDFVRAKIDATVKWLQVSA